ncbi:MAG: TonB family protein [Betaproteobacteria bacterium]|jgi:colicin import membrane protein|nr:TonB family protein [Betaproteobacteria bacterium]
MSQKDAHLEFAPPADMRSGRALVLALLVHTLLLLALTWGVTWKSDSQDNTVEAELWSTVPEVASQKLNDVSPVEPSPAAEPKPSPPPPPVIKKSQPEPAKTDADIATTTQKKKDLKLKQEEDKQKELEKEKKLSKQKEQAKRLEQETRDSEALRQEQINRLKNLGASSANPVDAVGETKSSGRPSDGYLSKLRNRVKPNITFSEAQLQSVKGNPAAEVEVICSPSGQILGMKLIQSSGNAAWDQAVMAAIEKTAQLPRDENGSIPSRIPFVFRPRD